MQIANANLLHIHCIFIAKGFQNNVVFIYSNIHDVDHGVLVGRESNHHFMFSTFRFASPRSLSHKNDPSIWWAACPNGSWLCCSNDHARKIDGSTPTQASLLRPWVINYLCLVKSNEQPQSQKQQLQLMT